MHGQPLRNRTAFPDAVVAGTTAAGNQRMGSSANTVAGRNAVLVHLSGDGPVSDSNRSASPLARFFATESAGLAGAVTPPSSAISGYRCVVCDGTAYRVRRPSVRDITGATSTAVITGGLRFRSPCCRPDRRLHNRCTACSSSVSSTDQSACGSEFLPGGVHAVYG